MNEELQPFGDISVKQQPPAAACQHLAGISETSSIYLQDQHWRKVEERVLEWLTARGVHLADPQQLVQVAEDRFKRSISMRNSSGLTFKPSLSKRVKMLTHLHINLEPPPHLPNHQQQCMADSC